MTDLGEFRDLLYGPVLSDGPVSLDGIVRRGRRLRVRRRLMAGVGWLVVLSVVAGGGFALWARTSYSGPVAAYADGLPAGTWGDPVETGMVQPGGRVALMLSFTRTTGMRSIGCFEDANRVMGGCRSVVDFTERTFATGFHAMHAAGEVAGRGRLPVFGYFIGPVHTISARADGRPVTAQLSVWSEDRDVTLFWFPLDEVAPDAVLTGWSASGADGRALPTGRARLDVAGG